MKMSLRFFILNPGLEVASGSLGGGHDGWGWTGAGGGLERYRADLKNSYISQKNRISEKFRIFGISKFFKSILPANRGTVDLSGPRWIRTT